MAKFPDESFKTGVWRVLRAEDFDSWLQAQSRVPSSIRYIVDHHTWSPATAASTPNGFLSQVLDIFRGYYEKPESRGGRGWERDHGPQLWLADIDGQPWVVIAANLWVHGPHCAYFNGCSVGIETVWNGDNTAWNEVILRGLYLIHKAFERRLGIPLKRGVTGPTNTNVPSANGKGWLFHRDAKDSNKSCPGTKNTHALLENAFKRYEEARNMPNTPSRSGYFHGDHNGEMNWADYLTRWQADTVLTRVKEDIDKVARGQSVIVERLEALEEAVERLGKA